jgi:hypothetical protein
MYAKIKSDKKNKKRNAIKVFKSNSSPSLDIRIRHLEEDKEFGSGRDLPQPRHVDTRTGP